MKRKRHSAEEIIKKLREAARLITGGKSAEKAARQIGVREVAAQHPRYPQRGLPFYMLDLQLAW